MFICFSRPRILLVILKYFILSSLGIISISYSDIWYSTRGVLLIQLLLYYNSIGNFDNNSGIYTFNIAMC